MRETAGSRRLGTSLLRQFHPLEIAGQAVDFRGGRGDPAGVLVRFPLRHHQRLDVLSILVTGKPPVSLAIPRFFAENFTSGTDVHIPVKANMAMEGNVGEAQPEVDAGIFDDLVPALDFQVAVVPQAGVQRRMVQLLETAVALLQNPVGLAKEFVIVLQSRS